MALPLADSLERFQLYSAIRHPIHRLTSQGAVHRRNPSSPPRGGEKMSIGMVMKEAGRSTESLHARRFEGITRNYTAKRRGEAARLHPHQLHAGGDGRQAAVGAAAHRGLRPRARRAHRQPGRADGARGPEGHLPLRLAGGGRRQHRRADVPRPEPLPGRTASPTWCARINQALRRADQIEHAEGKARALLVRAHHRRRRGGLRRAAQRLRADEGDDRGGRRGRALRGPARLARRSAATWAARCWCPTSQFIRTLDRRRGSRPT